MAECCHKYRAHEQKKVYLDQADRLSTILSELSPSKSRHKEDARAYHSKINALRMKVMVSSTARLPDARRTPENEPPETPRRNVEPIYVGNLKDRFKQRNDEMTFTPKDQPQADREELADNKVARAIVHEARFEGERSARAKTQAKDDEDPYSSESLAPRDQSEMSTSANRIQTVVSLNDNLDETTYI